MCDRSDLSDGDAVRPLILLLVADEPLREALRFSLETEGYSVTAPPCADDCSACVDCRAAACVIIDDGSAPLPTPVPGRSTIVLTSDAQRFHRQGVKDVTVVEKPLLDDSLGRELASLLAKH
jgi:hypothetical protein